MRLMRFDDCGPRKRVHRYAASFHEPIFVMQAAEYGVLYNPISDRQTVSVLVEWELLRIGLRQTGA
jgi:hypothetical protein